MTKRTKMFYILLSFFVLLVIGATIYLNHPLFGKTPTGERLERIKQSPNYINGAFQNIESTPAMTEGITILDGLNEVIFGVHKDATPKDIIPSVDVNLHQLDPNDNVLIWLGHSSYFLQIDGVKLLVDPVFSNNASPVPGTARAFAGADKIKPKDIPKVDYLLITHDHYDHLDYTTIKELKSKIGKIIVPLGVGEHLVYWGYDESLITELDWDDTLTLMNNLKITAVTARHGSGRKFKRNQSLWTSYVLETSYNKMFLGGDSGYGSHFKAIGEKYGPFDVAILENGQYNNQWKYIHMFPEQVLQATKDLHAKRLLPVHSGKFKLASHAWYEPLRELQRLNEKKHHLRILTPKIGQPLFLADTVTIFESWYQ